MRAILALVLVTLVAGCSSHEVRLSGIAIEARPGVAPGIYDVDDGPALATWERMRNAHVLRAVPDATTFLPSAKLALTLARGDDGPLVYESADVRRCAPLVETSPPDDPPTLSLRSTSQLTSLSWSGAFFGVVVRERVVGVPWSPGVEAITVRIEAPGFEPVERTWQGDELRTAIVAVLERACAPARPAVD